MFFMHTCGPLFSWSITGGSFIINVCLVALAVPMTGSVSLSFYNKIIRPTRTKSEFLIFLPLTCHVITSQLVILQNDVIDICRGVLNTPGPQLYLGLMIGIRASPGFDLTNFSIFYPILAFSLWLSFVHEPIHLWLFGIKSSSFRYL